MKKSKVAIVGALGAVGSEMTKILMQRNFPINKIKLLDIEANKSKKVLFGEKNDYRNSKKRSL